MHVTFSLHSSFFPMGFPAERFLMAIAQAIPPPMKNTSYLRIYVCVGSQNSMKYLACMLGLICEFSYDTTMFERILLSSEPPYNLQHH